MSAQSIRSSAIGANPAIPLNGHYPKWLQSDSGNVWLVVAPKTGVLLVKASEPFRNKRVGVGYTTTKLKEGVGLRPYRGEITLNIA